MIYVVTLVFVPIHMGAYAEASVAQLHLKILFHVVLRGFGSH